jgi:predicted MFS family arabinose efflux permease
MTATIAPEPAPTSAPAHAAPPAFSPYQKFVVAMLAFLQFTIILDFMIIAPLGAILLRDLHIATAKFGLVVSAYAFSAGTSGLLAAGFADKFDRKKLLLFFYAGFTLGTLLCGLAPSYRFLLAARVVTGIFGGVIGSIIMAIVADLFPFTMRGRVMGVIQTAFAAAQVLGLPIGLLLAEHWGWHAPFLMIVGLTVVPGLVIFARLKPVDAHLKLQHDQNALAHILRTVTERRYLNAFLTTVLLTTGGFMLMPFSSTFSINNLGIPFERLHDIYFVVGLCALVSGPIVGRFSDRWGKFPLFCAGSLLMMVMVQIYTHLGRTPMAEVIVINAALFVGVTARIVSGSALMSAIPEPSQRGSFMSVTSSIQQFAGGLAAGAAGLIVVQRADGSLARYDVLGYVVTVAMLLSVGMLYVIDRQVAAQAPR